MIKIGHIVLIILAVTGNQDTYILSTSAVRLLWQ